MPAWRRWYTSSRSIFAARPATSSSSDSFSAASRSSSADSYSQWRAIVRAQSSSCSFTSGAHRYSEGSRSNASSSAVVPRSRAASSYSARAWPISFCAIDENATSSSRRGAIPVHSESRQPRISSSSAISRSSCCSRSVTCLLQLLFQRIAVDAVIVAVELVDEVVDLQHRGARHDPERARLAASPVLLARIHLREVVIGRFDRAGVLERLPLPFLTKDFVDQAASASTTWRTHAE